MTSSKAIIEVAHDIGLIHTVHDTRQCLLNPSITKYTHPLPEDFLERAYTAHEEESDESEIRNEGDPVPLDFSS